MRNGRLSVTALAGVIFFIVCGGPFGIEDAVSDMGIWWTAVLVVALPFLWSLPIALVVFNGNFLYSSRIPYAMARDGWLPAVFARTTKSGSPFVALCALAAIAALLGPASGSPGGGPWSRSSRWLPPFARASCSGEPSRRPTSRRTRDR